MKGFGPWMIAMAAAILLMVGSDCAPAICENPPQWQMDGVDLMAQHRGNVTVVALLMASCRFCLWQAKQLVHLMDRHHQAGMTELSSFVINDQQSVRIAHYLRHMAQPIPVYQDRRRDDVWKKLQGGKDDFYIYDRCGRLAYYIPYPISFLYKPYVTAAILSTYFEEPCGPCPSTLEETNTLANCSDETVSENVADVGINSTESDIKQDRNSTSWKLDNKNKLLGNESETNKTSENNDIGQNWNATTNTTGRVQPHHPTHSNSTQPIVNNSTSTESAPSSGHTDHRHGDTHRNHHLHPPGHEHHRRGNGTHSSRQSSLPRSDVPDGSKNRTHETNASRDDVNASDIGNRTVEMETSNQTFGNNSKFENTTRQNGTFNETTPATNLISNGTTSSVNTTKHQCKMPFDVTVTTVLATYNKFFPNYEKILNIALEHWLQNIHSPFRPTTARPKKRENNTPKMTERGSVAPSWKPSQQGHLRPGTAGEPL